MSEIIKITSQQDQCFQMFMSLPEMLYPAENKRLLGSETIPSDHLVASYVLLRNSRPVARASLYHNPDLLYEARPGWALGNYECVPDSDQANFLLNHLIDEAKAQGADYLLGPMNGSTWENYRFATDHDNPPFFLESYHPLYYNTQFKAAGFSKIADYYTNADTTILFDRPDIVVREKALVGQGVAIRSIDLTRYETELESIYELNSLAFKSNFLHTPISKSSFMKKYLAAKSIVNPNFTLMAECQNQNLIGYYFCTDDLLNTQEKSLIVKTLVRHPDPQWRGLGHVMGNVVYRNAARLGYSRIIHSFIYQQGTSAKLSKNFSGINYRNYALYGKKII